MVDTGDPGFELWYREEHPRLVTLLSAAVGDADVARDAVDEALARAFERWDLVSQMTSSTGWVYRVALNVARRRGRRHAFEQRLLRRTVAHHVPGPTGELWMLVSALPLRQRTAVLLRHVGQLTEREVADVMAIARGTVSSLLRKAYARLEEDLDDESPAEKEPVND